MFPKRLETLVINFHVRVCLFINSDIFMWIVHLLLFSLFPSLHRSLILSCPSMQRINVTCYMSEHVRNVVTSCAQTLYTFWGHAASTRHVWILLYGTSIGQSLKLNCNTRLVLGGFHLSGWQAAHKRIPSPWPVQLFMSDRCDLFRGAVRVSRPTAAE